MKPIAAVWYTSPECGFWLAICGRQVFCVDIKRLPIVLFYFHIAELFVTSRYWDEIQYNIVHLCLARKVKSDMKFRVPFEPFSPLTLLTVEFSRGWDSLNMSAAQYRSHNVTSHVDYYTKRPKVSWVVYIWFIPQAPTSQLDEK
jgi:hypothetical protein